MKLYLRFLLTLPLLAACLARGQGTVFVYDQQSSTDEVPVFAGGIMQNFATPWGQSFTPTLSSVGFIRLKFADANVNDSLGATLTLNLRADSITGTLLSSTDPVALPNGFAGVRDFVFSAPVSVTPGTAYYFEAVVQSGAGPYGILGGEILYPGGDAIFGGQPDQRSDFWFREGIIVPEPSAMALFALGLVALIWTRNRR